jgi:uncharacterized membrane protein
VAAGVAGAIAVACALRFVLLTGDSLWSDEGFSINVAQLDVLDIARTAADADTHPPLFYTLLHYWMAVFGDSELAVRALPAVLGVLVVPVAYGLGSALAGRAAGLGAAYLVAVSPIQVFYSQEVRMYALLALTAGLSTLVLVHLIDSRSKLLVVGYALATAALLYSHVYGMFVLCAQAIFVVVAWRRGILRGEVLRFWVVGAAGALALFAPWGVALAAQASDEISGDGKLSWLGRPGLGGAWETLERWAGSGVGAIALCGIVFLAVLMVAHRRRGESTRPVEERDGAVLLLALLVVVPLALPFVLSYVTPAHIYLARYTTASALAAAVLVAVLAARLRAPLRTGLLAAVCITLVAGTILYHARNHKHNWRAAVAHLEQQAGPNDLVVIEPGGLWRVFDYYASADFDDVTRGAPNVSPEQLASTQAGGASVWLLGDPSRREAGVEISSQLRAIYGPPQTIRFNGVVAQRYGPGEEA